MDDLEKSQIKSSKDGAFSYHPIFTKVGAIVGFLVGLGAAVYFSYDFVTNSEPRQWNEWLATLLGLVLFFLTLYQLIYAAEASLEGKKLNLKKVIGNLMKLMSIR